MRNMPGYALVVAKNGPKLKEVFGDYEESTFLRNGKSTMAKFTQSVISAIDAPVVDKTGLAGVYEYQLALLPGPGGGGRRGGTPLQAQTGAPAPSPDRAGAVSAALEEQLGLRLQPEKTVPVD